MRQELKAAREELAAIHRSRSWRLTRSLARLAGRPR
jgi:hypothetical protein